MNVTTKPEQKPDVVITLSWRETELLRAMTGGTGGRGEGRNFTNDLYDKLSSIGVELDSLLKFNGNWND